MSALRLTSLGRVSARKPYSSIKVSSQKSTKISSTFVANNASISSSSYFNFSTRPANGLLLNKSFHSSRSVKQEENAKEASEQNNTNDSKNEKSAETQISDLKIQVEELRNKFLFSLAERENVTKRAAKEVENAKKFGITSFAKDLLSVADNLSRCLAAVDVKKLESNPELQELHTGIGLTSAELMKVFKNHQLEKFDPAGQKFDPNSMNAIAYFPDPSKEGGSVAEVLKSGYYLNGRVLRAADVAVVKPESVLKK